MESLQGEGRHTSDGASQCSAVATPSSISTPSDYDGETMITDDMDHASGSGSDAEMQDDDDGLDLPLVEYARLHGLTLNYLHQDPVEPELIPRIPATWQDALEDPASRMNIGLIVSLGALNGQTTNEKLDVDKETASLLSSVFKLSKDDDDLETLLEKDLIRFNDLKLEEPILATDPDIDLSRLSERNTVTISTDGMQPFPRKEIVEPKFLPGKSDAALKTELERRIEERLDMDKTTAEYLRDICSLDSSSTDENEISGLYDNRRVRFPSPETPPLMPSSPSIRIETTDGEAMEITLTSTPEDPSRAEAARLEQQLLGRDNMPLLASTGLLDSDDARLSDFINPEYLESSSSPLQRKRLQDLRVETPITPEYSLEHPSKKAKTVSFSEDIHTLIPGRDPMISDQGDDEDLDDFITSIVEPFAEAAMQKVENEKLDELDTTMRVAVPPLDDFEIIAPWDPIASDTTMRSDTNSHAILRSQIKNELHESEAKWSGATKIERQLPWKPFPASLGKVNLKEQFDDGSLARYIAELDIGDDIDVDSLICMPPGLKVLKDDEDEEDELEPVHFESDDERQVKANTKTAGILAIAGQAPNTTKDLTSQQPPKSARLDMQTLLNKRKRELEAASSSRAFEAKSDHQPHAANLSAPQQVMAINPTRFKDLSTTAGLANYINLQIGLRGQISHAAPILEQVQRVPPVPVMFSSKQVQPPQSREQNIPLPSPTIVDATAKRFIVVSTTLLSNRNLMREMLKALPGLEIVERDPLISSTMKSVINKSLDSEADITASPGTGILITTLQKLKQKPLPGQSTFFGVRERISLVSTRYNRLIVLVSEASRHIDGDGVAVAGPLDARDLEAISEVTGFVSSLDGEVEVCYVAGSETELARWVASCICQHSVLGDGGKLMPEETLWERLLRQAGMNAYAAQCVLSQLSLKGNVVAVDGFSSSGYSGTAPVGLAAFVQMTGARRQEMFGSSVGDRVLSRVSGVIDGDFIPASKRPTRRERAVK